MSTKIDENLEQNPNQTTKDAVYIRDLEKALADFKKFTETYIEEHGHTKEVPMQPPAETETIDNQDLAPLENFEDEDEADEEFNENMNDDEIDNVD